MNTLITAVVCAAVTLVFGGLLAWLVRPHRRLTDPEDYTRRSQYAAKRAEDELAAQERAAALERARQEWL